MSSTVDAGEAPLAAGGDVRVVGDLSIHGVEQPAAGPEAVPHRPTRAYERRVFLLAVLDASVHLGDGRWTARHRIALYATLSGGHTIVVGDGDAAFPAVRYVPEFELRWADKQCRDRLHDRAFERYVDGGNSA